MNIYTSKILTAGAVGGFTGAVINGMTGWFSKKTAGEIKEKIIIGIVAGIAIATLVAAIAFSNSTGAVLGGLAGLIGAFIHIEDNRELYDNTVPGIVGMVTTFSMIGYTFF